MDFMTSGSPRTSLEYMLRTYFVYLISTDETVTGIVTPASCRKYDLKRACPNPLVCSAPSRFTTTQEQASDWLAMASPATSYEKADVDNKSESTTSDRDIKFEGETM